MATEKKVLVKYICVMQQFTQLKVPVLRLESNFPFSFLKIVSSQQSGMIRSVGVG